MAVFFIHCAWGPTPTRSRSATRYALGPQALRQPPIANRQPPETTQPIRYYQLSRAPHPCLRLPTTSRASHRRRL